MKPFHLALCATVAVLSGAAGPSSAAELRVISAIPLSAVVQELGARFERETGHRLTSRFVSGPVVKREIDGGEPFDVALSITPVIDALVKEGKLDGATRADIAYAGLGVGVRAGAPRPDIGTVDAFRRALLEARSVAHSAEGASGVHFTHLLERLGIAERMAPKLRPMPADRVAQAVPSGQADMIVVTLSVIAGYGSGLVGPIPEALQFYNSFAGAISTHATDKAAAAALIRFLAAADSASVIRASGMVPGAPR